MRTTTWRNILAMILALALLVSTTPTQVYALAGEAFSDWLETTDLTLSQSNTTQESMLSTARIVAEDASRRGEFYKEYIMNNGLRYATVYPSAIHYEDNGQWKDIDNTLVAAVSGGRAVYQNTAGVWNVRFPRSLSGSDMIGITKDGHTVQFGMAGELRSSSDLVVASIGQIGSENAAATLAVSTAQTSVAKIQQIDLSAARAAAEHPETILDKLNSRLTYANVYPNTNVVYDLQGNQLKESVVMQSYDASLWGYRYTLDTGDLIPVLREDQQIDLCHPETNEVILTMPAPYMLDNNGEISYDVEVMLTRNGSSYLLSYYLPREWLADAERAWPVILDPVVTGNSRYTNVKDVTVAETGTESSTRGVMQCGYSPNSGIMRIYMQYIQLPALTSADVIVDATISLIRPVTSQTVANVNVHKVTQSWTSSTITWANKAAYEEEIVDYVVCQNAGTYTWNITSIVQDWYETGNYGMMFKTPNDVETGGVNNWKQFYSSDYSNSADTLPALTIIYQNHNGLEDYWSYSSSSAGRAGTGYVDLFTGNLVWVRNDLGFDGNRMPVSISHIYNSNDSQTNKFGMGYGWRTNYNQTITSDDGVYVWEDGDGTLHYFYPAKDSEENEISNTYLDEDGLHLTLTTGGSGNQTYQLTDQLGNKSYFDASGRLRKIENNQETKSNNTITYTTDTGNLISTITDGVGRVYRFNYYESGLLNRISFLDANSEECAFVSYEYTDVNLTKITDNDSKYTTYAYNTHRLLTTVQDVTNYCVTYSYAVKTDNKPVARVTEVSESQGDSSGNYVRFTYSAHYTKTEDQKNHPTHYQFNDWGNLVAAYDASGHVQYTRYATNDENDPVSNTAEKNQVIEISNMSGTSSNTISDSSFEGGEVGTKPSGWSSPAKISNTQKYGGGKSMRLSTAVNNEVTNTIGPSLDVGPGESCTFSAYVYCEDGASFSLALIGINAGKFFRNDLGDSSNGWMRFEVSYTNEGTETETVSPKITAIAGTTYFDCIQMEKASSASPYNAVANGDFSAGNTDGWTAGGGCNSSDTYSEAEDAANLLLSSGSLYLEGKPGTIKYYRQDLTISGEVGDAFVLSGWAKANALPLAAGREFGLKLIFHTANLNDGEDSVHYVRFDPDISNWQYAAMTAITDTAFVGITIMVLYSDQENWAYFDGIQLYEGSLGTVYAYDEYKNVKTETNALGQTTEYTYDENNNVDLVGIKTPEGRTISYEYDDYHNVTKMTETIEDPSGVKHTTIYKYDYNAHGSVLSVTVEQKLGDQLDAELTQKTVNIYTTDGNYLTSTIDGNGETTTYGYNSETGVLMWVQYPKDTEATRTEYIYDEIYQLKETKVKTDQNKEMSVGYTYENDLLKKIMTKSTTYSFTYGKLNLCASVNIGNQALATYEYTDHGELKKLTYGNGDRVEYQYDNLGRVVAERYYEGDDPNVMSRYVTYVYSNGGTLAKVDDHALDKETYCQYDSAGRVWIVLEVVNNRVRRMVTYSYDDKGNISKILEETDDLELYSQYLYDYKNRIQSVKTNDAQKAYLYDDLDRLTKEVVSKVESEGEDQPEIITEVFTSTYDYYTTTVGGTAVTTNQVKSKATTTPTNEYQNSLTYKYDGNGNIESISDDTYEITYEYDSANQLIRENNPYANYTWVWTYDDAGNIQSRKEYAYTIVATAQLGAPIKTYAYAYGNSDWGDLLTSYNGRTFIYDDCTDPYDFKCGNLTDDGIWTYTWQQGRQLAAMSRKNNTEAWSFEYDANGMRTRRTNGTETYTYSYNDGLLSKMTKGDVTLYFTYDAAGTPLTVDLHYGTNCKLEGESSCGADCNTYYYVTNLQGDVIALLDSSGNAVVEYAYDAWGNVVDLDCSVSYALLASSNPLLYRGYVYDQETGLYYLQSRYYNPEIGRFINADNYFSTGQGLTGNNMFAYCGNNPVSREDEGGEFWLTAVIISAVVAGAISAAADAAIQAATTGEIDPGQVLIAGVSGAISGACALIPGGAFATTAISIGVNAALNAGSYVVNQLRKGEAIDKTDLWVNVGIGAISGAAGNLFRFSSTGAIRNVGEKLVNKGMQKITNGVMNSATSTIKRGFQYIDRGISMIYQYAARAGVNSGFGSTTGCVINGIYSLVG